MKRIAVCFFFMVLTAVAIGCRAPRTCCRPIPCRASESFTRSEYHRKPNPVKERFGEETVRRVLNDADVHRAGNESEDFFFKPPVPQVDQEV